MLPAIRRCRLFGKSVFLVPSGSIGFNTNHFMKEERRVVGFVAWSTGIFLVVSLLALVFGLSWTPFNRINLLSDVVRTDSSVTTAQKDNKATTDPPQPAVRTFDLYQTPARVIGFSPDTSQYALPKFLAKIGRAHV